MEKEGTVNWGILAVKMGYLLFHAYHSEGDFSCLELPNATFKKLSNLLTLLHLMLMNSISKLNAVDRKTSFCLF